MPRSRIEIARAYDVGPPDGEYRVLIDRLWPRGVSKESLAIDEWRKELAPSTELRRWFDHQAERWDGFREKYRAELEEQQDRIDELLAAAGRKPLLLIYGARDELHNNAIAFKEFLEDHRR